MLTYQSDFYPSDNNFTQALLVMLLTNMISAPPPIWKFSKNSSNLVQVVFPNNVLSISYHHPEQQAFAIWVVIWHLKYHGQFAVRPREI